MMNKINEGGQFYEVGWTLKIPFTRYWIVWLRGIKIIEVVEKHFHDGEYCFCRIGYCVPPKEREL